MAGHRLSNLDIFECAIVYVCAKLRNDEKTANFVHYVTPNIPDSYSSSGWDMEPAHVSSFAYQPFSEDESSSWVESVELMQPDGLLVGFF